MESIMHIYLFVFFITLLAGVTLIKSHHLHGHFSMDGVIGVQKHHSEPTPRIGGLALVVGFFSAWMLSSPEVNSILGPMLLAAIPAFAFGLGEDVSKRVGVMPRLLATMCSGAIAWYLSGIAMQNTGVPPLDWLLAFTPLAVLFTAFAVGGVANAINIIDGFNGLASGSVAIMLGAFGLIAFGLGDMPLVTVSFIGAFCALGFVAANWPMGKLFLGDGGAYLLGFVLAWVAVLLPMRNPQVTAWVSILVCAYPVLEVAFSVQRRRKREGHHPGQPDKAHLHHLLNRRVVRKYFPNTSRTLQNGLTAPIGWMCAALPAGWAVYFSQNTLFLIIGFLLSTCAYSILYTRLIQFNYYKFAIKK